jgi:ketosteroid isomerase-like protein
MIWLTRGLCAVCVLTAVVSGSRFHGAFRLKPNSANPLNSSLDDRSTVAALDERYQSAVKRNDVGTMDRILADDFVLVTGSGKNYSKADLLKESGSGEYVYEHQEDAERNVRLWGDIAVVTAKLWAKGMDNGRAFDHTVWFSDVYIRTPRGWRYVFGQSSLPLPQNSAAIRMSFGEVGRQKLGSGTGPEPMERVNDPTNNP